MEPSASPVRHLSDSKLLWGLVIGALVVEGIFVVRHETQISVARALIPPDLVVDAAPGGGPFGGAPSTAPAAPEATGDWLDGFSQRHGLDAETTDTLRGVVKAHATESAGIRSITAEGGTTAEDATRLQRAQQQRQHRAIEALLGTELAAEFERELESATTGAR